MNRIIKFRAWDKKEKKMFDSNYGMLVINKVGNLFLCGDEGCGWELNNKFIVMQFTGLKDKNGKEIYEGDIVKYYDSYNMWITSKVKDVGGAFAVLTDENPILLNEFCHQYECGGHLIKELEVIGNIYENKELLK